MSNSETRSTKNAEHQREATQQETNQQEEPNHDNQIDKSNPNQENSDRNGEYLESPQEMRHGDPRIREARSEKFTTREISESDADKQAMRDVERAKVPDWKREQVVKSSVEGSLHSRNLKGGDKLYRFDSAEQPDGKNPENNKSCYWLDENGYDELKKKPDCYDQETQQWNSEGVKNHLALPCNNRADCVVEARVSDDHKACESTIAPAKENLYYRDDRGELHQGYKEMSGGEQQITPDSDHVKDGHLVWKKAEQKEST